MNPINEVTRPEDLIPTVKPAYGPETARVVLDIVRQFPERHFQRFFEADTAWIRVNRDVIRLDPGDERRIAMCGTTHCVAGWAVVVHRGAWNRGAWSDDEFEAAQMLGIHNDDDADELFFGCMNEAKAVGALEYLAKGDRIDWAKLNEVYGD